MHIWNWEYTSDCNNAAGMLVHVVLLVVSVCIFVLSPPPMSAVYTDLLRSGTATVVFDPPYLEVHERSLKASVQSYYRFDPRDALSSNEFVLWQPYPAPGPSSTCETQYAFIGPTYSLGLLSLTAVSVIGSASGCVSARAAVGLLTVVGAGHVVKAALLQQAMSGPECYGAYLARQGTKQSSKIGGVYVLLGLAAAVFTLVLLEIRNGFAAHPFGTVRISPGST